MVAPRPTGAEEMPVFVLALSLRIEPGRRDEFLAAIAENATAAVRDEPGCLSFDVVQSHADPDRFLVYERYADEAAFDAHRATPHFAAWRQVATEVIAERVEVNTPGTLVHSG